MKKIILLIIALASLAYSVGKVTIPQRGVAGQTITATRYNQNLDTLAAGVNRLCDTVNINVPRFHGGNNHDSTMQYLRVDTISGNPYIDSALINGNQFIVKDTSCSLSLYTGSSKLTTGYARFYRVGKIIMAMIPLLQGVSTTVYDSIDIPLQFRAPTNTQIVLIKVQYTVSSNIYHEVGRLNPYNGYIVYPVIKDASEVSGLDHEITISWLLY